jgi:hypothetical protein
MAGTIAETSTEDRKSLPASGSASRSQRRTRGGSEEENGSGARYFLAKPGANGGSPVLEREIENENEALVESFRLGVPYYSVQEWRAVSDLSGRNPRLKREAVAGNGK